MLEQVAPTRAEQALEENLWSMWSQFGRAPGCSLNESAEALWFETPIPVHPYNMVVRFQGDADDDALIDLIFGRFRGRGVPFLWLMHPSARPIDLAARLARRGFDEEEPLTGMCADLADLPPVPNAPDGVEIHAVTPQHDLRAFSEFVASRWHIPETAKPYLRSILDVVAIGVEGSPNRAWIAVKDGIALAKVVTHDAAGAVGVYGVATKPEARGRGLAHFVCLHALHEARGRGHDLAILHSTPMAESLYRSLGFRALARLAVYAAPHSFYA